MRCRKWDRDVHGDFLKPWLHVVISAVFAERVSKGVLAEQDQTIETLGLDLEHPALRDRVHVRSLERGSHDLGAGVHQDASELSGELAVAVDDQVADVAEEAVGGVREIARHLCHERRIGVGCDPCDVHSARGVVDHEQDVVSHEAACGPDLGGEEVSGGDHIGVRPEERAPRRRPLR